MTDKIEPALAVQRLQCVGGPRDGQSIALPSNALKYFERAPSALPMHTIDGPFSFNPLPTVLHVYEVAEWRLDEGSVQRCLRYVGEEG